LSSRHWGAAKDLDDDLKSRHPQIPWRQILGMRNILAHEYFIGESDIIWETLKAGAPRTGSSLPNRTCASRLEPTLEKVGLSGTVVDGEIATASPPGSLG
jgi:hypothetical protein